MATPAQLMETISAATGTPLATVIDIDRKLTKAGLRTIGGRGFSAARMTPKDAARLLTAMLAAPQSNEAAMAVDRYTNTRVDIERSSDDVFGTAKLDDLVELTARHDFVTGLAAVITSAAEGALLKVRCGSEGECAPKIEIFAFTGQTYGRIRISGLPNRMTANVEYLPARKMLPSSMDDAGDLEQSRRIATTMLALRV